MSNNERKSEIVDNAGKLGVEFAIDLHNFFGEYNLNKEEKETAIESSVCHMLDNILDDHFHDDKYERFFKLLVGFEYITSKLFSLDEEDEEVIFDPIINLKKRDGIYYIEKTGMNNKSIFKIEDLIYDENPDPIVKETGADIADKTDFYIGGVSIKVGSDKDKAEEFLKFLDNQFTFQEEE